MKNADMPAMPLRKSLDTWEADEYETGGGRYLRANGLTKREMFAMNAPDCPMWYKSKFIEINCRDASLVEENYILTFNGEMRLFKQWCYAYADLMLGDLE